MGDGDRRPETGEHDQPPGQKWPLVLPGPARSHQRLVPEGATRGHRSAMGGEAVDADVGSHRFTRLVWDALAHLYDPAHLQTHPLIRLIRGQSERVITPLRSGRALRQELLDTIAMLRPSDNTTEGSTAWRAYRILQLRYVEAWEPRAVREQLALGKSQYYLEHARAMKAVVSLLVERWQIAEEGGHGTLRGSVRALFRGHAGTSPSRRRALLVVSRSCVRSGSCWPSLTAQPTAWAQDRRDHAWLP